jgi:hypothetical protein
MSNPIPKLLFEAKKLFNPLSEKALSLPDKEFESAVMYATSDERTEFLKNYYTKLSDHQFRLLVPFSNPIELANFLLEHYAELSEEILFLVADFCSFVHVVKDDIAIASFVQSANQCRTDLVHPPGIDLRMGRIKYQFLREQKKLSDKTFYRILRCAGSVGVLGFLEEYYSRLSIERFSTVIHCITELERVSFLKEHYVELSDEKFCDMVVYVGCSDFLYEHHVELSDKKFHSVVVRKNNITILDFLEKHGCELSDERFRWMLKEIGNLAFDYICKYYQSNLSDERFRWVMEEIVERYGPYKVREFLMDHYTELSDERFRYIVENTDNGFILNFHVRYSSDFGEFFKYHHSTLSDTQFHLMLKKICLRQLNHKYSKHEDDPFRSVILKIKSIDRGWFIYSAENSGPEIWCELSDKRFILVVQADPRQLDELPWEMATRERQRLIGILQQSLDRIKAGKAWIEATDSGINCFPIVQLVLACLQGLVK